MTMGCDRPQYGTCFSYPEVASPESCDPPKVATGKNAANLKVTRVVTFGTLQQWTIKISTRCYG